MKRIVVWLAEDYSKSDEFKMNGNPTKLEITKAVNKNYPKWYYYDIWP